MFVFYFLTIFTYERNVLCRKAVQEKAECVARCTEQICTTIVEETLNADITALVETILEAKLQCIQKYITR